MGTSLCRIMCAGGGEFQEKWGTAKPVWCCGVIMRLKTPIDCISHPYWMYTKCFSTLRCCGWAYHVQVGVNLRENEVWPSLYDVAVSWLRLKTPIDCIPHPYWMYAKSFSTLRCCGWAYGCINLALLHVQVGVNFRGNVVWALRVCIMLWCHGWGWKPL